MELLKFDDSVTNLYVLTDCMVTEYLKLIATQRNSGIVTQ